MLERLDIQNLATVSRLALECRGGLNVLTGETGAGKSIILGALQILLGERAEKTIIRRGETCCEITATFQISPTFDLPRQNIDALLTGAGLEPAEEGVLILRRLVTQSGTRTYVNATPVPLQLMRQLGELLVDIHGPHDHQSLLKPSTQLALLDAFAGHEEDVAAANELYHNLEAAEAELTELTGQHLSGDQLAFMRHQLQEVDAAGIDPAEERALNERHHIVANSRRLLEIASQCQAGLAESDGCICDQSGQLLQVLMEMESIAPKSGGAFRERLEQAIGELQELSRDICDFAEGLDLDQQELQAIEERLNLINQLKRKHGGTLEAVLEKAEELRQQIDAVDHREGMIEEARGRCEEIRTDHLRACTDLTAARRRAADQLATAIEAKLRVLGFAQSSFAVTLTPVQPGRCGADRAEFCFAPNPGEEQLPLRKIASSGEIARVMLAIKTILSAADNVPVLIFDEVDANIGGRVATAVAAELAAIADRHQVLCITHLPQIAAAADLHFLVGKEIRDARTQTRITRLDEGSRIKELTRMMGATDDSAVAAEHAREMLASVGATVASDHHAGQPELLESS